MSATPLARLHSRRGFLSGLASLPLIGGGVALVGNPTAAAEPATRDLLFAYSDWLRLEYRVLAHEVFPDDANQRRLFGHGGGTPIPAVERFFIPPSGSDRSFRDLPQPSTRAAVVMAAVGCEWREAGR